KASVHGLKTQYGSPGGESGQRASLSSQQRRENRHLERHGRRHGADQLDDKLVARVALEWAREDPVLVASSENALLLIADRRAVRRVMNQIVVPRHVTAAGHTD